MSDDEAKLTRRETLRWIAAASLAGGWPLEAEAQARPGTVVSYSPTPNGYGPDPRVKPALAPWPRIMRPRPRELAARLADLVLPGSATAPAPSAVGIAEFFDEWVSAPYPVQLADRATVLGGLDRIDAEARRRWNRDFLELDDRARAILVGELSGPFFKRFRFLVVAGYYTTPEGHEDIGYRGNVPVASYPPITDQERRRLDQALAQLGL